MNRYRLSTQVTNLQGSLSLSATTARSRQRRSRRLGKLKARFPACLTGVDGRRLGVVVAQRFNRGLHQMMTDD